MPNFEIPITCGQTDVAHMLTNVYGSTEDLHKVHARHSLQVL